MKRILGYLLVLPALFSLLAFELPNTAPYTQSQIEAFVREVFADQADAQILKSDSDRFALIKNFLSRVEIRNSPEYKGKKFQLLSTIALQNKYNPALTRDAVMNPDTFNPLKYRFEMSSTQKKIYRFDGTDYLITIQPVN